MRTKCFGIFFVAVLVAAICSQAIATPFDPLVAAGKVTGRCTVLTPGADKPVDAETGKAYPYGSALATAAGASMQVILSSGNECTLSGEGYVVASEDKQTPTRKLITVESGKLDVSLEPGFTEFGALDVAGTCLRASITKGGKLSFDASAEGELRVFMMSCEDAVAKVSGPQFSIPQLDKDDVLMAACAPDLSFIRLKAAKGAFDVTIRDAEGAERVVPMETGSMLKILQKRSEVENMLVVTVLIIGADETVQEAITYSVKAEGAAPAAEIAEPAAREKGAEAAPAATAAPIAESQPQPVGPSETNEMAAPVVGSALQTVGSGTMGDVTKGAFGAEAGLGAAGSSALGAGVAESLAAQFAAASGRRGGGQSAAAAAAAREADLAAAAAAQAAYDQAYAVWLAKHGEPKPPSPHPTPVGLR